MQRFSRHFEAVGALVIATVIVGCAQYAWANQQSKKENSKEQSTARSEEHGNRQQASQDTQFNANYEVTGKISDLHKRSVESERRLLGTVTGKDGGKVMVDLGNPDETKKLELKDGDEITISGPIVRFEDRQAVLAERVKAHDKSANIAYKLVDVSGQLTEIRYTALTFAGPTRGGMESIGTTHLLAAMNRKDGKTVWVDFGPGQNLVELKLNVGDKITAHGTFVGFQKAEVLVAHDIEKAGQKLTVDWKREVMVEQTARPGGQQR